MDKQTEAAPDLTLAELSKIIPCSKQRLSEMAKAGSLRGCYRFGRRYFIRRDAVDELRGIKPVSSAVAVA